MNNKSKILYLYKLLYEKTDEEKMLSTSQIIELLAEQGIETTRKTVASDIALLIEFGVDIITVRSSQNLYYIGNREFEFAEVKLLVDAVEASKIITTTKSKKLIKKLSKLVSNYQSTNLNSNILIDKRIKPTNEDIYNFIDKIHNAISTQQQISFKYCDYNGDKEFYYKHEGRIYNLSPYSLVWNDDYYYVIGYCSNHKGISTFRVDRMAKVEFNQKPYALLKEEFNISDYVKPIFNMYHGDTNKVELKCNNNLMKVIIDKFGEDVETYRLGSNCFKAIVNISVSPTFFAWVFSFGTQMSILSPIDVKKQYRQMLEKSLEQL